MKKLNLLVAGLLFFTAAVASAQVTVTWQNTATTLLLNGSGVTLSQGVAGTNNDGMLIQLGFFAGQTGTGFAGTWMALTGFGSTLPRTTIGDASNNPGGTGEGNGRFNFLTNFTIGSNVVSVYDPAFDSGAYNTQSSAVISPTSPPDGQVLSIRFYDTTDGASGHYNTVQAAAWVWHQPSISDPNPSVTIFLGSGTAGVTFEDPANPFRTSLLVPIPEPTTLALLGVGLAGVALMRQRAKVA